MDDQRLIHHDTTSESDLLVAGLIDSIINRAERITARDLKTPAAQAALVRLAQDKTLELLLKTAGNAATVAQFDIDIKEAPAE